MEYSFLDAPKRAVILRIIFLMLSIRYHSDYMYFWPTCCAHACPGTIPWEILQTFPTLFFSPVSYDNYL